MANFSAADVKKLRELTGAGMMDCKRALDESDGDFDKAVEILRIKGAKDIGKRAERTTAEGLVAAAGGALIELDSETDFVAKNDEFQQLAERVVNAAAELEPGAGVDAVLAAPLGTGTVADAINAASVKLGEKLELRRVVKYDGPTTVYLHKRSADLPPSIGVLVQYTGDTEAAAEAARGAAMQIASLKARYVTRDEIPADVVEIREADRRGDRPRGGQAGSGPAQDRRGPGQRVLQGRGARRAVVRAGLEEDRRRVARARPASPSPRSAGSRSERPDQQVSSRRGRCDSRTGHDGYPGFSSPLRLPRRTGRSHGRGTTTAPVPPGRAQARRRDVRRRRGRGRSRRGLHRRRPDRRGRRRRRPGRRRHRRRQLLPRRRAARARHGPGQRRLHGHARHRDELPCAAGLPGTRAQPRHPGADRHHDGPGRRALHPAARRAAPGKGPGGDLRRRRRACRTSPPTPPPRSARWRSAPRWC